MRPDDPRQSGLFSMMLDHVEYPDGTESRTPSAEVNREPAKRKRGLEADKAEALRVAREHYPDADDIRLCLTGGELIAEVWKGSHCTLRHTEVFTEGKP